MFGKMAEQIPTDSGNPDTSPINDLTFEEAFSRHEKTVQDLESGGVNLKQSTDLYEQGIKLAQICNEWLNATELKINHLQTAFFEKSHLSGREISEFEPPENDT